MYKWEFETKTSSVQEKGKKMKIAYITAQAPYSSGEAFILPEVLELMRKGCEVTVFPLRPNRKVGPGIECQEVANFTKRIPLIDLSVFSQTIKLAIKHPTIFIRVISDIVKYSDRKSVV